MRSFEPIAIVGRSCLLPGALSPEQLWELVASGRDAVSSVDPGRWRVAPQDVMCEPGEPLPERTWTDRGGYVRGFEGVWDPEGFAIPAAKLQGLDPLVHWVLHCARAALADAGDDRRGAVERPRVAAVFGNLGFPTEQMNRHAEDSWLGGEGSDPGAEEAERSAAPRGPMDPRNRFMSGGTAALLERALGLMPGVIALDTACASSLYAIELACALLQDRRADRALAGAVNRADDLFLHVGFAALGALSRSGRSRPFHAEADGLLPAEGAGFVALERLADARAAGRRIYGVIRGVGLSNDGRGRGFLAPDEHGQRRAITQAYARAGVDPRSVSLLECHATGTVVGDATELRSYAAVFEGADELPIGSLKSNLGHAITAAGVAGLVKVLEALRHDQRPPSLHADALNPTLARTPLRVLRELEPWPRAEGPRIAGLSAFGFGGNNAHLIVSDDDPSLDAKPRPSAASVGIAIVGLGTIVGEAHDTAALERALLGGASLVRDDAVATRSFELGLSGVRFPPNDLRRTLPQQLLALAAAREALEGELEHERSGVFVGLEPDPEVCRNGARWRVAEHLRRSGGDPDAERAWVEQARDAIAPPLEAATVIGTMPNIPANRINAHFNLGGPSWSVFGSEASGRHALALGCRALREEQLDAALVCAVDLSCQDIHTAALRAIEGRDEPPGDAAVALLLRRLPDAERRGDPILAVLEPGGAGQGTLDPEGEDSFGLRARLGRSWAAGDLRDIAAAALAGRRGALPDGRPWPSPDAGARGLNIALGSAAIWHADPLTLRPRPGRPELIPFAAANEAELDAALAHGRIGGAGPCKAVVLASGPAALDERVARARRHLQSGSPRSNAGPGVFVRRRPVAGQIAFVFNGAGAAYPGMGAELLAAIPSLGAAVRERSPALASYFERPWPADEAEVPPLQRLWAASYLCQAHARLSFDLLGLRCDAVIGYSSGESNSLFATGIWTDHDAMVEACRQSEVFTEQIGGRFQAVARAWGSATASWETWTVLAPIDAIERALEGETRAHLTVIHHDHEAIVAGDPQACARIRERLGAARWLRLHYDLAVHTPELAQIREAWLELHRRPVTPRPSPRVYSGAHGGAYDPSTEACAQAILGQAERRLDFRAVIEQAYQDGVRVFVEHGPRAACSRWITQILGEREAVVVALDRPGASLEAVLEAAAALTAAGVGCDLDRLRGALARQQPKPGPVLRLDVHPAPIQLPPRAEPPRTESTMQVMPPAPLLPPVDAPAPVLDSASQPVAAASPALAPRPAPAHPIAPGSAAAVASGSLAAPPTLVAARVPAATTRTDSIAAAYRAQLEELGQRQREFVEQQAALHQQFLALREQTMSALAAAARGRPALANTPPAARAAAPQSAPSSRPVAPSQLANTPPAPSTSAAPPRAAPITSAAAPQAAPPPTASRTASAAPPKSEAGPTPPSTSEPSAPPRPSGPTFTREQLEVHASGKISTIFGPQFAGQDQHHRQVRMPEPPLLLADRVTGLAAEPMSMKLGSIWTETDVREDAWYLHDARMPAGIMIESGQADLLLISYLGVDAENQGERVYRLLGCTLTYHGGLPEIGETLCYDIHLDGHAKQGGIRLMFFHYDCHIDGQPRLSVRKGQAGFFTDAELAASDGCLWRPEDQAIVPEPRLDPPALRCDRAVFSPEQVAAFAAGRPWECFGDNWREAQAHTRTPRITGGRMLFFDRVDRFEVRGGPWERGYLAASCEIQPDHWFFEGHFLNDPCMPGTLMFEGCLQAMAFFLAGLGYTVARDGWRFEPVQGEPFALSCRGQVTPRSKLLRYEVFVEEVVAGPIPTLYADLLCTVDGLKAFHARRVGLRLVPAWPLEEGHPLLDRHAGEPKPVARAGDFEFDFPSMLACAQGRPTTAFGMVYARFDSAEPVARLPNPPYHFISRAVRIDGQQGAMQPGMSVEVEYDIPPEAWYFAENGARVVPFAVLLEAALQPCGWLASYMGCALSSKQPLMFRNLDGTGTIHAELRDNAKDHRPSRRCASLRFSRSGVLKTRVINTRLSKTPSMIIVGFEVECRTDEALIYTLDTVFGFFPAAAFENQAGLPTTAEQRALFEAPSAQTWALDGGRSTPGRARMARPMLLMLDRVSVFDPQGGHAGLGFARAEKQVDPSEWFFKAHFFQDPVQPGSLGIEAMLQLLQWTMLELGMDADMAAPRFEAIAVEREHTWKYRGQVVPSNRTITTTLELSERGHDDRGAYAIGDLSLWVDGKRIYEAIGLGMRIVDDQLPGRVPVGEGRRITLDPASDRWITDHCPTYTVPALPMMSMVELLASAVRDDERLLGLRDVRVKGWVVVDRPTQFRCERDRERVRLLIDEPEGEREVATGRLVIGRRYGVAPKPLPALAGPVLESPYESGELFHGPAFQLLERLVRTPEGASSLLRVQSEVPIGRLNPALLDAATHGIAHDRLQADKIAYPAWIPELELFGPTPREGTCRCEVRFAGQVGSPDFPSFEIQLIGERGVWARLRLVEACFPKGKLGHAAPRARRAFLRDHLPVPGLALAELGADRSTLSVAEVDASDWLPGTVAGIYGAREPATIAQKEHVAAAHGLHPRHVPEALPLTGFDLEIVATEDESHGEIEVRGDARGSLDITPVREFWTQWFDRGPWPVEDLYYGLIERFVDRVVLADPEAFAAVRGRSLLYLGNHQVGVESLLFSVIASGLSAVPTVTLAKIEHKTTWLGRLIAHCFAYPGVRDPKLISFFDREDKGSLARITAEFAAEMRAPGRSVMVHIEGTRSLTCAKPVEKMSGTFLDLAIAVDAPVVPIRFIGGLPVEPLSKRLEFPLGMGKQAIWIGRPIPASELSSMPYGERKRLVIERINALGCANAEERPLPGDPEFAARVAAWQAARGVSHEHATLRQMLAERAALGDAARRLIEASSASELAADASPEGQWLSELARRLLG
ncbi:MAG: beta-ketoacyl synthase N-terminal-like domain-containing protein [Enhygromyxa sp.]